jgi:hypothetical protein
LQLSAGRRYQRFIGRGQTSGSFRENKPVNRHHQQTELIMKTLVITASLVASLLAGALSVQAADRPHFDAQKLFDDIANRAGQ